MKQLFPGQEATYRKVTWFMEKEGGPWTQDQNLRSNGTSSLVQIQAPKVAMGQTPRVPRDSYSRLWSPKTLEAGDILSDLPTPPPPQVVSHLLDRTLSLVLLF